MPEFCMVSIIESMATPYIALGGAFLGLLASAYNKHFQFGLVKILSNTAQSSAIWR